MAMVLPELFPIGCRKGMHKAGYYLGDYTKKNLDFIKQKVLTKKIDYCFGIDGNVGVGKTTLMLQIAKYLDNDLNLDNVTFTPQQFLDALKSSSKGQAVILDEALVIGSRYAMSEFNKKIVLAMSQIRSKQMFIFFVLPAFFDLDRNLALFRISMLYHCYTPEFAKRGWYSCYFQNKIKGLYLKGKPFYSYAHPTPNYRARFGKFFILDEVEYEKKKQKAVQELGIKRAGIQTVNSRMVKQIKQRDLAIKHLKFIKKMSNDEIARNLDLDVSSIPGILKREEAYYRDLLGKPQDEAFK